MEPISVKIIYESKDLKLVKDFSNSLYAQLAVGENIELDIQGNIIECVVIDASWNFNFFGNVFEIRVKPVRQDEDTIYSRIDVLNLNNFVSSSNGN